MLNFHLITNIGSLLHSKFVQDYPNTLCLAQYYIDVGYAAALRRKVAKGHRVILDNGAHEGIDFPLKEYKEIVMDLKPKVVVLTDLVGRHYEDSRESSLKFVTMLNLDELPDTQFMYVPQGKNKEEVLLDYRWALLNLDPKRFIIGFGQGYLQWAKNETEVNFEATRQPMINAVMQMPLAEDHEFHVLGARWSGDNTDYGWFPQIRGIDTIKPATCTWFDKTYPFRPSQRSMPRESLMALDEHNLCRNINAFCKEYRAAWVDPIVGLTNHGSFGPLGNAI